MEGWAYGDFSALVVGLALCHVSLHIAGGWALGAALNQFLSSSSSSSSSSTTDRSPGEQAPATAAAGASPTDQQPLCRAVLMTVPSLDPLGAVLERPDYELGDPRVSPEVYDSMTAWSPYDGLLGHDMQSTGVVGGTDARPALSVRAVVEGGLESQQQQQEASSCYPALLLRIGLYDTEVPYWEPARYMARLRRLGVGRRRNLPLLMQVSREAPHGSCSLSHVYHEWNERDRLGGIATCIMP